MKKTTAVSLATVERERVYFNSKINYIYDDS